MTGDSSALHHRLSMITKGERSVRLVAFAIFCERCFQTGSPPSRPSGVSLNGCFHEHKECVRC